MAAAETAHPLRRRRPLRRGRAHSLLYSVAALMWAFFICHENNSSIAVVASSTPHQQFKELQAAHHVVAEVSSHFQSASYPTLMLQKLKEEEASSYRGVTQHHDGCIDLRDDCPVWKEEGLCDNSNPQYATYMTYHCARTCQTCHWHRRKVPESAAWTSPKRTYDNNNNNKDNNTKKVDYQSVQDVVGADTGTPQTIPTWYSAQQRDDLLQHVKDQRRYLQDTVQRQERYRAVRSNCINKDPECTAWALAEECQANPVYMQQHCVVACFACHELDIQAKCPVDRNAKNALYPGDLNRLFERIVSDPVIQQQYNVTVLSRPAVAAQPAAQGNETLKDGPWIVQLDNFFNETEAERLLEIGTTLGFHRSMEVDERDQDYVSDYRTSETAWCDEEPCIHDAAILDIQQRMHHLTQIPTRNSESLQFLRYNVGGWYKAHNDYIGLEVDRFQGVRILTIFLYLNNAVPGELEGGGTHFPELGLTVQPAVGRAVIWPSVLNEDPHQIDPRTEHEALPVTAGQKFGVNAWIHQREHRKDCLYIS